MKKFHENNFYFFKNKNYLNLLKKLKKKKIIRFFKNRLSTYKYFKYLFKCYSKNFSYIKKTYYLNLVKYEKKYLLKYKKKNNFKNLIKVYFNNNKNIFNNYYYIKNINKFFKFVY
jgi:hypothetical protein